MTDTVRLTHQLAALESAFLYRRASALVTVTSTPDTSNAPGAAPGEPADADGAARRMASLPPGRHVAGVIARAQRAWHRRAVLCRLGVACWPA